MASTKRPATKSGNQSRGVLHKAFQPGKDGHAYLYHWVKFTSRTPPGGGKAAMALSRADTTVHIVDHDRAARTLGAETTVVIVDHDMAARTGDRDLVTLDIKQPKSVRSNGYFSAKMLPAGTTRKKAEDWIKSREGKAWAAGQPVALSAIAIRML